MKHLVPRRRLLVRGTLLAFAAAGVAAGVYLLAVVPPSDDSYYPRCQFHSLTGLHCPGCGTTRALHSALNGRFDQAAAYNPLAFIIVPIVGASLVGSVWSWGRGSAKASHRTAGQSVQWLTWSLVVLMMTFWVVRNIPVYPFTLLAPHELSP